jgi:heterotetrameric sarcosine oxidase gamma subunit
VASLSAFAGCAPVAPAHEAARATPVEPLAAVSVAVWPGRTAELSEVLRGAFGLTLPEVRRWTQADALVAVWLGPNHFSLQREDAKPLLPDLAPVVGNLGALIDVTDARATLRLTGEAARKILASLLPIDLHPRSFAPGRAATTIASHLTVQLRQLDAAPTYDLAVSRSFAGSLWRALELAGEGRLRLG